MFLLLGSETTSELPFPTLDSTMGTQVCLCLGVWGSSGGLQVVPIQSPHFTHHNRTILYRECPCAQVYVSRSDADPHALRQNVLAVLALGFNVLCTFMHGLYLIEESLRPATKSSGWPF